MGDAGIVINTAKREIENKLERSIVNSENYTQLTQDNNLTEIKYYAILYIDIK